MIFVPVSLFEYKPEFCPFGHKLWPGMAQVSWKPCLCAPAREAAELGRGMGHVCVSCNTCHEQLVSTVFYEPPHSSLAPGTESHRCVDTFKEVAASAFATSLSAIAFTYSLVME